MLDSTSHNHPQVALKIQYKLMYLHQLLISVSETLSVMETVQQSHFFVCIPCV